MPSKERYVVPNPDKGGWDSKRENAERASEHFETKKEAMDWSREKAKQEKSELVPHGKDGKIQNPIVMAMTQFLQRIRIGNKAKSAY